MPADTTASPACQYGGKSSYLMNSPRNCHIDLCPKNSPTCPAPIKARLDFKLERGILVQGKITDKTTGKPVAALVEYHPALDNPNISSREQLALFEPVATHPDGTFTLVALPGPGLVAATAMGDRFLTVDLASTDRSSSARPFPDIQGFTSSHQCHAFEAISLETTAKSFQCDMTLTPGPEPVVTILDPDGKPLAGALHQRCRTNRHCSRGLVAGSAAIQIPRDRPDQPSHSNSVDPSRW